MPHGSNVQAEADGRSTGPAERPGRLSEEQLRWILKNQGDARGSGGASRVKAGGLWARRLPRVRAWARCPCT